MIFIDFDGTIVEIWKRYYSVFSLGTNCSINFEEYVYQKRTLKKDDLVANYFHCTLLPSYYYEKKVLLESTSFLVLDRIIGSCDKLLHSLNALEYRILTKRRSPANLHWQMRNLHLDSLIDKTIILNPDADITKKDYLRTHYSHGFHTIIGDSQAEWECSELNNVQSILVCSGLENPYLFALSKKMHIVNDIYNALDLLSDGDYCM